MTAAAIPDSPLPFEEVCTGDTPTASVIWLHGLGADGNDFVPVVPMLGLPNSLHLRFIFPHAPVRPVTLNGGMPTRAWFDIISLNRTGKQDSAGIKQSAEWVEKIIQRENARGIPTNKIVLAGFSQGGAIAMYSGLRLKQTLAGIMGLSTYLPAAEQTAAERSNENLSTPVVIHHGRQDPVLQFAYGEMSRDLLKALSYNVSWQDYNMAHQVLPEQILTIGKHLADWLSD